MRVSKEQELVKKDQEIDKLYRCLELKNETEEIKVASIESEKPTSIELDQISSDSDSTTTSSLNSSRFNWINNLEFTAREEEIIAIWQEKNQEKSNLIAQVIIKEKETIALQRQLTGIHRDRLQVQFEEKMETFTAILQNLKK